MNIDQLIDIVRADELFIWETAAIHGIDPLTLRCSLLLHLPQFESFNLRQEIQNIAIDVKHRQGDYSELLIPPENPITLDQLTFMRLDDTTARVFHENFHYVGSFRPGEHFAMTYKSKIVCMGSIAQSDLGFIQEPAFVYTRFFAFRWAPKNIFTYFQSRLRKYLIGLGVNLLVSFINPNIGFNGKSHFAAQWKVYAYEHGTEYYYVDGKYRTMRYIKNNPTKTFTCSKVELKPLIILVNPIRSEAKLIIPAFPHIFQRPSIIP